MTRTIPFKLRANSKARHLKAALRLRFQGKFGRYREMVARVLAILLAGVDLDPRRSVDVTRQDPINAVVTRNCFLEVVERCDKFAPFFFGGVPGIGEPIVCG